MLFQYKGVPASVSLENRVSQEYVMQLYVIFSDRM